MMATVSATCCCAATAATALLLATFNVPAMYMAIQTVLYVSGHTTDIVMDSGDGGPIYEGYTLHHAIFRLVDLDFSLYLMKNLTDRGYSLTVSAERKIARDVKEKLCHIGVDYDSELKSDENIITVGDSCLRCAEVFIQPSFTGKEAGGFLNTPFQNFMKWDVTSAKSCT